MVAMEMRNEDQVDRLARDVEALERRQRGGAAIDQKIDRRARDVEAGVLPAARAERVAAADELQLHRLRRLRALRNHRPRGAPKIRVNNQIGTTITAPS